MSDKIEENSSMQASPVHAQAIPDIVFKAGFVPDANTTFAELLEATPNTQKMIAWHMRFLQPLFYERSLQAPRARPPRKTKDIIMCSVILFDADWTF